MIYIVPQESYRTHLWLVQVVYTISTLVIRWPAGKTSLKINVPKAILNINSHTTRIYDIPTTKYRVVLS